MVKSDCNHIKECSRSFVSYKWLIGIVFAMIVTIAAISYAAGSTISTLKSNVVDLQNKYEAIERYLHEYNSKLDVYNEKLDTLLKRSKY